MKISLSDILRIYEMLREGRLDGSRKSRSCSVTGSRLGA